MSAPHLEPIKNYDHLPVDWVYDSSIDETFKLLLRYLNHRGNEIESKSELHKKIVYNIGDTKCHVLLEQETIHSTNIKFQFFDNDGSRVIPNPIYFHFLVFKFDFEFNGWQLEEIKGIDTSYKTRVKRPFFISNIWFLIIVVFFVAILTFGAFKLWHIIQAN